MANVYVRSGASGANNGTSKTDAYTTLSAALAASAAGDVFYVASDHAESTASAVTLTSPGTAASPCQVICVTFGGSTPPASADVTTGATVTTTGANGLTIAGGYAYWHGIAFACGTGSSLAALSILSGTGGHRFSSCEFQSNTTSSSASILVGSTGGQIGLLVEMDNCTIGFSHVSQSLAIRCTRFTWRNSATPLKTGGAYVMPTTLLAGSNRPATIRLEGLDLSGMGSGKTIAGNNLDPCEIWINDCKIASAVTVASTPSSPGAAETYLTRTDASATNYVVAKYSYSGTQTSETAIVRTGGSSTGATAFSSKIVTTANCRWTQPFEGIPMAAWNATVGSSVTVTVEGIWDAAALPNNDDVWFDVRALTSADAPLGDFVTGSKANAVASGSALTASTQAWDSLITSRANSAAYTLGQTIKVASNAGRVFFCTTAGTTAGSEPGGYASAVDGGSVTDGTAVFRAGVRFKKAVSVTPQIAGALYAIPKAGKASSTFYLDQKITLA